MSDPKVLQLARDFLAGNPTIPSGAILTEMIAKALVDRETPVEVAYYLASPHKSYHVGDCSCGKTLRHGTHFCSDCGRPIKWK